MMPVPEINDSQFQDILQQVKALLPFYTPEWKITDEKTPDAALLKIFAHMQETIISRLNRVPDKNFIAFLEMLGVKLIPAQSARAPLTFILSQGATENVLIPERTQAAAGELVFETEKNFLATPAKLVDAYSLGTGKDEIFQSPASIIAGKTISPFSTHLVYKAKIGEKDLFLDNVSGLEKGDTLKIGEAEYVMVSEVSDTKVGIADELLRDYDAATPVAKVATFELFEGRNIQEHILYLGHKDLFNIKPAPGSPSNLSLRFAVLEAAQPKLPFEWSYWGEDKKTKKDGWILTKPVSDGTSGFTKNGDIVLPISSEIKETDVHGVKSKWLRCKVKAPVLRNTKLPLLGAISVGMQNTLTPDMAFYNDVPLDLTLDEKTTNFKEGLYPFGKKPRLSDTFYLGSSEALSKKEARITLAFSIPGAVASDTAIEQIHGIGPTFAQRLKAANINTVGELLKSSPEKLMGILKTNKKDLVTNILTAARSEFIEASRTKKQVSEAIAEKIRGAAIQDELTLSWEYWNGNGWTVIKDLDDGTDCFRKAGVIIFDCPSDIEASQVGGQKSYWIRVRIVGGDYGKELVYDKAKNEWVPGVINPPRFSKLTLTYSQDSQNVEGCLSYNNLEYVDITAESKTPGKPFKPFHALDDEHKTMYLGCDKKLESGPISLFFALEEAKYIEETMPKIVWEYFAERGENGEWARLEVLDGTRNLTRSGTVEFVVPTDVTAVTRFGKELYWIRAVDVEDRFQSLSTVYAKYARSLDRFLPQCGFRSRLEDYLFREFGKYGYERLSKEAPKVEPVGPCAPSIEVFQPLWAYPSEVRKYPPNPKIDGIYLNTTWAIQADTIRDEIMGSSNGEAKQTFPLTKTPVTSEEIWVNEVNALGEKEMKDILASGEPGAEEVKDDKGNTTGFWVRWQAVDDLLGSSKDSRNYEIDRISGNVRFGDGVNGAVPPIGADNIKADYRSGGGKSGNVGSLEVTALKTSIPFVDKVSNPVAGGGGSDVGALEEALERGPQIVRHRNRAVARDDFEWLARQASSSIARARCLPDFDDKGEHQPGWVTVIIVPRSEDEQPKPSLDLKSQVESYLKAHSANTVVSPEHLQVSGPVYVAVGVEAAIVSVSMDDIPIVENEAVSRLKAFLHPLSGGYEGKGWDFGRAPCLSDFFALLEKIPGVNYVKSLSIRMRAGEGQSVSEFVMTPDMAADIEVPPYTLVFSGEHKITATFEKVS